MAKLPASLRRGIKRLDVHSHAGFEPLGYLTHGFPYCLSLRESHADNVRIGTTHSVVFPFCTTLYYKLPALQKVRIELGGGIGSAPFAFENEHLLRQLYELFPAYRNMFIPFAIADTMRETRQQVKVLEKLIDRYPFYGIKVHPRTTQARISTLAQEGKPLLEFARAHNLPFLFHAAWPGSPDPFSQISYILDLARDNPDLRFCAAHFCGFHQPIFDEIAQTGNIWVDSAAMGIGCDLVLDKSDVYDSGRTKIPGDYRDPASIFAKIARRYPNHFMWGTDNPGHTFVSYIPSHPGGKPYRLNLWSTMERERDLLRDVRGGLRRKVAFENALRFIEG